MIVKTPARSLCASASSGLSLDRTEKRSGCFFKSSAGPENRAQLPMKLGNIRTSLKNFAVNRDRLVELPLLSQQSGQIPVRFRKVRPAFDRPTDQIDCHVAIAPLTGQRPQQMQRLGMIRLVLQDLAIDSLSRRQLAGLMLPPSQLYCVVTIHGRYSLCRIRLRTSSAAAKCRALRPAAKVWIAKSERSGRTRERQPRNDFPPGPPRLGPRGSHRRRW